jgi:hypothetical protein
VRNSWLTLAKLRPQDIKFCQLFPLARNFPLVGFLLRDEHYPAVLVFDWHQGASNMNVSLPPRGQKCQCPSIPAHELASSGACDHHLQLGIDRS